MVIEMAWNKSWCDGEIGVKISTINLLATYNCAISLLLNMIDLYRIVLTIINMNLKKCEIKVVIIKKYGYSTVDKGMRH